MQVIKDITWEIDDEDWRTIMHTSDLRLMMIRLYKTT
jgi:hypothetical protein